MTPNFEVLESQPSEVEIALLIAVNLALDAALVAGSKHALTLAHLEQHEKNFQKLGKRKAAYGMAALKRLHANAAGVA